MMGMKTKKTEVKRELIFALMIIVIFVALLVTWTVVGSVDERISAKDPVTESYGEEGGEVELEIVPAPEEVLDGSGE